MTAGEPSIMPTLPCAKSAQTSLRSVPPGFGCVSPDEASCFMKFRAVTLAALSIVYLPAAST